MKLRACLLATGILVNAVWSTSQAEIMPVESADVTDYELRSFVVAGTTYTQADLIQPTLAAYVGYPDLDRSIAVGSGESVPPAGERAALMTHDFRLNTGLLNIAVGDLAATISFASPLVNGLGPDLVIFEMQGRNPFQVRINSTTMTVNQEDYGPNVTYGSFDSYRRDGGPPSSIEELENGTYEFTQSWEGGFNGVALDLDDFGIAPFAAVSDVHFGSVTQTTLGQCDPGLFMGIRSVPEPSSLLLMTIACMVGVGWWYRHRTR